MKMTFRVGDCVRLATESECEMNTPRELRSNRLDRYDQSTVFTVTKEPDRCGLIHLTTKGEEPCVAFAGRFRRRMELPYDPTQQPDEDDDV